ncbi:hypothetical protein EYZ11_011731 [Aspergillus tanneri]|uniref:Uncharacterized protein n=1 Tax=Aspergillus tanneri TaxID=1220188 RepID=A0A4S3J242_9EURO|nr:uncharacterized protein ATNIH1004_009820 [Aspergillus tanneri]KAA8643058.1 hypothetical protein ATNIH1004_009820 [Aspergillus tanneri]THC88826.1 hypothetical protein EYZ11_011731 [Aspergillus tanneri]
MSRYPRPLRLRAFNPWKSSSRCFSTPKDSPSRLHRFNDRLPPFLRSYTTPLLGAPGTHITSFLILHEITAIVPLFALVAAFHYGDWLPDLTSSKAFEDGTQRFGRWLRKKGWVVEEGDEEQEQGKGQEEEQRHYGDSLPSRKGVRLVWEFATAYAITKALLPLRLAASVGVTPWFARVVLVPVGRGLRTLLRRQ